MSALLTGRFEMNRLVARDFDADLAPGKAVSGVNDRPGVRLSVSAGFVDDRKWHPDRLLSLNLDETFREIDEFEVIFDP